MSVEEEIAEAKAPIIRCVREIEGHVGKKLTPLFWDEALDKFALRVQAAMPCSNPWRMELQFDDCAAWQRDHEGYEPEKWCASAYDICPACVAKMKLKKPEADAGFTISRTYTDPDLPTLVAWEPEEPHRG